MTSSLRRGYSAGKAKTCGQISGLLSLEQHLELQTPSNKCAFVTRGCALVWVLLLEPILLRMNNPTLFRAQGLELVSHSHYGWGCPFWRKEKILTVWI